jgi:TonB family protein
MRTQGDAAHSAWSLSLNRIGKYEILRELGRGAMGTVYQARDPFIGRLVALKTITASVAGDPDHLQRFQREAQAAGSLQHPNIVTIYEMGTEDAVPFLVMEYLDGEGLDRLIARRAPIPFLEKLSYLVQLCRALHQAHESGVVHRDVKPANVVVKKDGTIKVVDFGIARLVDTTRTQTGVILGTVAYMSPQQLHGQRADERSDIWATGVLAYELLTSRKPFSGENHGAMILEILTRIPEPLPNLAPDCPSDVQEVVARAMHKEDTLRYQSMSAMLADLEPIWKRELAAGSGQMLDQAQQFLGKDDYKSARKQLEEVLRLDRENATAAVLLEELRCAREGIVLQQEVLETIERGRAYLEQGLFSDARSEASDALRLDPKSKAARELLDDAKEIEAAAQSVPMDSPGGAPVLEREYAFQGKSGKPVRGTFSGTVPLADAKPITATVRAGPSHRVSTGTIAAATPPATSPRKQLRWLVGIPAGAALVVVTSLMVYRRPATSAVAPSIAANSAPQPVTANLGDRQRTLIEQAYEAADRNDYTAASAKLDEADHLQGPLGPRIADLRHRFTQEEQNAGLRAVAQQEGQLWTKAMDAMHQNRFDEASSALRSVLQLPDGGRRREDADRYLGQVIPQHREEEKLFAQASALAPRTDVASLHQESTLLERIVALNGPHRSEAERMRRQASDRLAALVPKKNSEAVPLPTAVTSSTVTELAKPAPELPREPVKLPDTKTAEAAEAGRFVSAVEHFEKASRARDQAAMKNDVLPEFQKIAHGGGSKAGDAQRYASSLIPAAIREAAPWPMIGCPALPGGLTINIKPGDMVACGMLDSPRLKWDQFSWPEFPQGARQAGQQKGVAMLSVTVDENGEVTEVHPRGPADGYGFVDVATSAARRWKTTPPRAQGKPVKTIFAVDVTFTP